MFDEEDFLNDDFLIGDLCMMFLFLRLRSLDWILGLYCFKLLCLDLWCGEDAVSESSEFELEAEVFVIAVIIVLGKVPKKP